MSDRPKHRFQFHERLTQWVIEEWSELEGRWIFVGYAPPEAVQACAYWTARYEAAEAQRDRLAEALLPFVLYFEHAIAQSGAVSRGFPDTIADGLAITEVEIKTARAALAEIEEAQ